MPGDVWSLQTVYCSLTSSHRTGRVCKFASFSLVVLKELICLQMEFVQVSTIISPSVEHSIAFFKMVATVESCIALSWSRFSVVGRPCCCHFMTFPPLWSGSRGVFPASANWSCLLSLLIKTHCWNLHDVKNWHLVCFLKMQTHEVTDTKDKGAWLNTYF